MDIVRIKDSLKEITLPSVIIKAFEQNRKLKDVPAAVNYIGKQNLESFSPSSIVSAINSTPVLGWKNVRREATA